MYSVNVYNPDNTKAITKITRFINFKLTRNLNKISLFSFSVWNDKNLISEEVFNKKNIVEFYKWDELLFFWRIDWVNKSVKTRVTCDCKDMLSILQARIVNITAWDKPKTDILNDMLTQARNVWNIFIDVNANITWNANIELLNSTWYSVLESLYNLETDFMLEWKTLIIADKIEQDKRQFPFKKISTRNNETNIKQITLVEDWNKIYNNILWKWDWVSYNAQDQDSIDKYWILQTYQYFSEAKDQGTLNKLVDSFLNDNKEVKKSLKFIPISYEKFFQYWLWDIVNIIISDEHIDINENLKIVSLEYDFTSTNSTLKSDFRIELSEQRIKIPDFLDEFIALQNKIKRVEWTQ